MTQAAVLDPVWLWRKVTGDRFTAAAEGSAGCGSVTVLRRDSGRPRESRAAAPLTSQCPLCRRMGGAGSSSRCRRQRDWATARPRRGRDSARASERAKERGGRRRRRGRSCVALLFSFPLLGWPGVTCRYAGDRAQARCDAAALRRCGAATLPCRYPPPAIAILHLHLHPATCHLPFDFSAMTAGRQRSVVANRYDFPFPATASLPRSSIRIPVSADNASPYGLPICAYASLTKSPVGPPCLSNTSFSMNINP